MSLKLFTFATKINGRHLVGDAPLFRKSNRDWHLPNAVQVEASSRM
jgi:hypothetical protein